MKRDDLRVLLPGAQGLVKASTRPVSDAELAEMGLLANTIAGLPFRVVAEKFGYVQPADCETCKGTGESEQQHIWLGYAQPVTEVSPCPSCKGSGKGRLVSLGPVDLNALRLLHDHAAYALRQPIETEAVEVLADLIDRLAALDKGETDV